MALEGAKEREAAWIEEQTRLALQSRDQQMSAASPEPDQNTTSEAQCDEDQVADPESQDQQEVGLMSFPLQHLSRNGENFTLFFINFLSVVVTVVGTSRLDGRKQAGLRYT